MSESNGYDTQSVMALLEQLKAERFLVNGRIEAAQALLSTFGISEEQPPQVYATGDPQHPLRLGPDVDLHGLSTGDAIVAWARAHNGMVDLKQCAEAAFNAGVSGYISKNSAQGSLYYYINKDSRFTKVSPAMYRFKDSYSDSTISKPSKPSRAALLGYAGSVVTKGKPSPSAVGRDHSLVRVPARFAKFDINRIRGKFYLDAVLELARFAGGTVSYPEIRDMFWLSDMAPTAEHPNMVIHSVHGSLNSSTAKKYIRNAGRGVYQLVAQ